MREVLPGHLYDAIKRHLITCGRRTVHGWDSGYADEDTLTGDVGATLRRPWGVPTKIDGTRWQWRVTYKKFRGRGEGAFEKSSGADGIFQVEVRSPDIGKSVTKGLLFQAKKDGQREAVIGQVKRMEELAPNGSAVFEYGQNAYRAASGNRVLNPSDDEPTGSEYRPFGDFLGHEFLACSVGLSGMYFDAVRQVLIVPTLDGVRAEPVELKHRVLIEVVGR